MCVRVRVSAKRRFLRCEVVRYVEMKSSFSASATPTAEDQALAAELAAADADDGAADDAAAVQALPQDRFPPLDPAVVQRCKSATCDDVTRIDRDVVERGMFAFFNNDFAGAEALYAEHYRTDPLIANAYGTLGTIRAVLSFDPKEIAEANNRLLYSAAFGNAVLPPRGSIVGGLARGVASFFSKKTQETPRMSTAEFRAHVVIAESELLRAQLLLLQDSITAYLKAGLCLRRGYNTYDKLRKYIDACGGPGAKDHNADPHSLGGMHFGLGAIHAVTSILPPKILFVLKSMGYMHDRVAGFQHLNTCLNSGTLRAPIASLLMLAFHSMLPSFATLTTPMHLAPAEQVLATTLRMFPASIIHLWMSGRFARLRRNVDGSLTVFRQCVEFGNAMGGHLPQLKHFALYDEGWSHCAVGQWRAAANCFAILEKESNWSRVLYAYAQGCCCEMLLGEAVRSNATKPCDPADLLALRNEAAACFYRSDQYPSYKLAGKTISVEQFVRARLRLLRACGYCSTNVPFLQRAAAHPALAALLPGWARSAAPPPESPIIFPVAPHSGFELAMLFNVFTQTPPDALRAALASIERSTQLQEAYLRALLAARTVAPEVIQDLLQASSDAAAAAAAAAAASGASVASPQQASPAGFGGETPVGVGSPGALDEEDAGAGGASVWNLYGMVGAGAGSDDEADAAKAAAAKSPADVAAAQRKREAKYVARHVVAAREHLGALFLARATLLRELGRFREAHAVYATLLSDPPTFASAEIAEGMAELLEQCGKTFRKTMMSRLGSRSSLTQGTFLTETWVLPHACYESAVAIHLEGTAAQSNSDVTERARGQNLTEEAKQRFASHKKMFGGTDYSFEMQMGFRLHLTNDVLQSSAGTR